MERSKLSRGLRLLSTGQLLGLIGALGMLASSFLLMIPVLSNRPANPVGLVRFNVLLMVAAFVAVIVGAVLCVVAQVKLWGEHPDYRLALILNLAGAAVNLMMTLLKQSGPWVDLLKQILPGASIYLTVRATSRFLVGRRYLRLARRGWITLVIYFATVPVGSLLTGLFSWVMERYGLSDSLGAVLTIAVVVLVMELARGILVITYLRASSRALEAVGLEEPVLLSPYDNRM